MYASKSSLPGDCRVALCAPRNDSGGAGVRGGEPPRGAEPMPASVLGGRVRLFRFPIRDVYRGGESCCFSVVKAIDKLRVKVYNYPTAERRPK